VRGAARQMSESAGLSPLRHRPAPCGARCAIDRRCAGRLRLAESAGLSPLRYRPAPCGARCAIDRRRARRAAAVWVAGSYN